MSTAGGLHMALLRGKDLGCQTVQLFTHSPSQWAMKPLTDEQVALFRETHTQTGVNPVISHDAYLINLAASDSNLLRKSRDTFLRELVRAEKLGMPFVVTHMGAHTGDGEVRGLSRLTESVDKVLRLSSGLCVKVALETTSGGGTILGYRFEHLRHVIENVSAPERVLVCFDACHVFAAGYDLRTPQTYAETWAAFDAIVGLDRLCALHLNDSKYPLGSRRDRHEHIGQGYLGTPAFRLLVTDPRFQHVPMLLETPKVGDMDRKNLRKLRRLARY